MKTKKNMVFKVPPSKKTFILWFLNNHLLLSHFAPLFGIFIFFEKNTTMTQVGQLMT